MMQERNSGAQSGVAPPMLVAIGVVPLTLVLIGVFVYSGNLFLWAILGLIAVTVLVVRPDFGVLMMVAALSAEIIPGARFLNAPYLIGIVLAIPLAAELLRDGEIWSLRDPAIRILLAIGALYLVSTWWNGFRAPITPFPELDKTEWLMVAFIVRLGFLILFIHFVNTPQRMEAAIWLMVGLFTFAAVDSWSGFSGAEEVVAQRAEGEFGASRNSNRLAFVCMFSTALLWFFYARARGRPWKFVVLPLIFLLVASALAAGSRSGLLQAVVLVLLIVKDQKGGSLSRQVASFLVIGCAALFLLSVVPSSPLERATSFDPDIDAPGQESLVNRLEQVKTAARLFVTHPLLGIGIGNFETMSIPAHDMGRGTHNSYLRALSEGGIGVFALYIWLFVVTFRRLAEIERSGLPEVVWIVKGVRAAFVVFLVYSATADIWVNNYLYMLLGLSIAMNRFVDERRGAALARTSRGSPAELAA
jgi:O-antigen ligase